MLHHVRWLTMSPFELQMSHAKFCLLSRREFQSISRVLEHHHCSCPLAGKLEKHRTKLARPRCGPQHVSVTLVRILFILSNFSVPNFPGEQADSDSGCKFESWNVCGSSFLQGGGTADWKYLWSHSAWGAEEDLCSRESPLLLEYFLQEELQTAGLQQWGGGGEQESHPKQDHILL